MVLRETIPCTVTFSFVKIVPLKPDFVVLMHAINDLSALHSGDVYWNDVADISIVQFKRPPFKEFPFVYQVSLLVKESLEMLIPHTVNAIKIVAMRNPKFEKLLITLRDKKVNNHADSKDQKPMKPIDQRSNDLSLQNPKIRNKIIQEFRKSIQFFVSICKLWEIKPVLMTQPNLFTQ